MADIYGLLKSPDRYVRYAGRLALEHTPRNEWSKLVMAETNLVALTEGLLALANTARRGTGAIRSFARCSRSWSALMQRTSLTPDEKIRVLRTFEVAATQAAKVSTPRSGSRCTTR